MAGVAGPMLRSRVVAGARFLAGLLVGELLAGSLLAIPAFLLGEVAQATLSLPGRLWVLVAACVLFGVADLSSRTPGLRRQVPEHLIQQLPPGMLGVAWGFDLGLLFTTHKVSSFIWVALVAGVLLDPVAAAALVVGVTVGSAAAMTVLSVSGTDGASVTRWIVRLRLARRASGVALLTLAITTAVQAWSA